MNASAQGKKWLVRSVSVPVQECLSQPWPDFCRLLHQCWQHSTSLANWAAHTLRAADVVRTPGLAQLPPLAPVDLYALAFGRAKEGRPRKEGRPPLPVTAPQYDGGAFWGGAKIAAATLLRKVDRKYRQERGKIVWRRERRTPEYLYPYPFPVHQQAWEVIFTERDQPVILAALPGGRVSLRLRQGPEFLHARKLLREIEAGDAAKLELSLCGQSSHAHARTADERRPGGAHTKGLRIMVRIACRREARDAPGEKTAVVRTGADPFLSLVVLGEERPWVLHAPWARMWIVEHTRFLRQFADDLKYEKRWPAHKRRGLNHYRERRCEKHDRRMKSFLQQTAAQVAGHAARRKCGRLVWDDADRSFTEPFPWHALRQCVQNKCDELGLVLDARGPTVGEIPGGARVEANP